MAFYSKSHGWGRWVWTPQLVSEVENIFLKKFYSKMTSLPYNHLNKLNWPKKKKSRGKVSKPSDNGSYKEWQWHSLFNLRVSLCCTTVIMVDYFFQISFWHLFPVFYITGLQRQPKAPWLLPFASRDPSKLPIGPQEHCALCCPLPRIDMLLDCTGVLC